MLREDTCWPVVLIGEQPFGRSVKLLSPFWGGTESADQSLPLQSRHALHMRGPLRSVVVVFQAKIFVRWRPISSQRRRWPGASALLPRRPSWELQCWPSS